MPEHLSSTALSAAGSTPVTDITTQGITFTDTVARGDGIGGRGYHLIVPFCQTSTRSRTRKSTVMIVEKNAAMMIKAA